MNQDSAAEIARSVAAMEQLSPDLRLMTLAYSRMNRNGHAHFDAPRGKPDESELRQLLGHIDKKTGELKLCAREHVYRLKKKLAETGFLVEAGGGLVCVWVAHKHATKGAGGAGPCPFHEVRWTKEENVLPGRSQVVTWEVTPKTSDLRQCKAPLYLFLEGQKQQRRRER